MNHNDVLLLGVKSKVLAISKLDGRVIWSAELESGMGDGFVTVLSDGKYVFAHTHGRLYCLDFMSGCVLWTNELKGCGYGLATLCLAGGPTAPNASAAQHIFAAQQAAASTVAAQ